MTLYLVTGPPASGKSTYVQQRARNGDVTIDYDALATTLTPKGCKPHDHPAHIKAITKAARQAAIDAAIKVSAEVDVYVIHSMPSPALIAKYVSQGAQVITIDPGRDVVMARCKAERPWRIRQAAKEWYTARQQTPQVSQQTSADMTRPW